jgi:peptide/nickel transport system permease protein
MVRYLARRSGGGVVVVMAATIASWLLVNVLGNPARLMLPISATPDQVTQFSHQMGFDRPTMSRLVSFAGHALTGNFGTSYWQGRPAMQVVLERVPKELELIGTSIALAFVVSLVLGVYAAQHVGSWIDRVIVAVSVLGVSVPAFWLGELLAVVIGVKLRLLPVSGSSGSAIVLPMLATAALPLGRLTQVVRSSVLDERERPYVLSLRARGVRERAIWLVHAARNAGAAIVTMGGWEVGRLLAGFTVTIEVVFAWPGLGQLAVQAIQQRDLPLIVADVFVVSCTLVALNIVVDVGRTIIDHRVAL